MVGFVEIGKIADFNKTRFCGKRFPLHPHLVGNLLLCPPRQPKLEYPPVAIEALLSKRESFPFSTKLSAANPPRRTTEPLTLPPVRF